LRKKVAVIGTVGLPANYGGFETLTENLTRYLDNRFTMIVFCSGKAYSSKQNSYNGAELKYIPLRANGIQSIFYDIISIISAIRNADVLLILGVSGCIILPLIKWISNKKLIVNIDGLEWKRAKWGRAAKWFLKYSENLAVRYADIVVSDNRVIKQYVQDTYNVHSALIAYGGDHTQKEILDAGLLSTYPFLEGDYAFKVCRIEPENNVHVILKAFAEYQSLNLVIVGNWNNSEYSRHLRSRFGDQENIYLFDAIYDQNTLDQIRSNSFVYIHGHSAGGTNPSLVEAMNLELPVIAFGVNYNKETTANKALYFNNKEELVGILENLNDKKIHFMAGEMKTIADEKYSWEIITDQYASLF